jgi:endonuclease/exonuclease/phosphatase family metal-dependent hydrolase
VNGHRAAADDAQAGGLRPYQAEAADLVAAGLRDGGTGQLRMPCGTGKTHAACGEGLPAPYRPRRLPGGDERPADTHSAKLIPEREGAQGRDEGDQTNRLNIATLSLGEGRTAEQLPGMAGQAGDVDLLLVQAGKGWHQDGQKLRFRAERLLASIGLDRSLMTAGTHGTLHTLIFWRTRRLQPVAHYTPLWPDVPGDRGGLAEFTVGGFERVVSTMSVQWTSLERDIRLEKGLRLTQLAAPDAVAVIAGDFNSLWPDCAGHREFEPASHALPADMRHQDALVPGMRPDGTLSADRRALTVLAEAGFRSAGCIAGIMTPTVNDNPDTGPGGRVDHIVLSPPLAGCLIPGTYAVHVFETRNRASDHRLVSVSLDLDQFRPEARA